MIYPITWSSRHYRNREHAADRATTIMKQKPPKLPWLRKKKNHNMRAWSKFKHQTARVNDTLPVGKHCHLMLKAYRWRPKGQ